jgi:hypothetical protein
VVGSQGALASIADSRIVLHTETGSQEVFAAEPGGNAMFSAHCEWAGVIRDAVRDGAAPAGAPTFADGLAWNEVMDRIRAAADSVRRPRAPRSRARSSARGS